MRNGIKHFCKVYVYVASIVFGDYKQNLACMSIFNHSKLKKHVGNFRLFALLRVTCQALFHEPLQRWYLLIFIVVQHFVRIGML